MGTFNTKKILYVSPEVIPTIAERISDDLRCEGYEVEVEALSSGNYDISITKGGMFKAVLGLKSALKITLTPLGDKIMFNASVGIFGRQVVPIIVMYFVGWPLLITQIWGLVRQSKLDDRALAVAEKVAEEYAPAVKPVMAEEPKRFCTQCGARYDAGAKFCSSCGTKL